MRYFNIYVFPQFFVPLLYIISAFLVGIIFEKIVVKKLKKLPALAEIQGKDVIKDSQAPVLLFFLIAGIYGAAHSVPVNSNIIGNIEKIIIVTAIVLGSIITANVMEGLISYYSNKTDSIFPSTSIFVNLIRIAVYVIGLLIMLQSFGISIAPILTALGLGGLAVALALKDTLTNLFAGLNLIASRQINLDDYIRLDSGEEGYVADITWRDTVIKTGSDNLIIIPNQKLAAANITNFNNPDKQIPVTVTLSVAGDSNLEKVEKITLDVAKEIMQEVEGAVAEHEPVVRFNSFSDAGVTFNAVMRAEEFSNQYIIKHEFIKRLSKAFNEENIEIAYPFKNLIDTNINK